MNGYLLNLEPSNLQSGPSGETELADSRNWFEENKESNLCQLIVLPVK